MKAQRIAAPQGDRYAGHPQRRPRVPRPLPALSTLPFFPATLPRPRYSPCPHLAAEDLTARSPMLSPSLQICCQGPLAAACGTGRRPRHSCGADLLANPDAAAGWRRGMVASGHPAAAPSPPPPAQRQRQRSCGAYLLRGCADAAAGRLRCTVASGPPAAPRHRRPLTTTCCTGRRRGRCCWADLPAARRRPNSAPAPRLLAVVIHVRQAPMPRSPGDERQITDKEEPRFTTAPLQ